MKKMNICLLIFFYSSMLCLPAWAAEKTEMPAAIKICCQDGSYLAGGSRSLNAESPLGIDIVNYRSDLSSDDWDSIGPFLDTVSSLTGLQIERNPNYAAPSGIKSRLSILVLPTDEKELSLTAFENISNNLRFLSAVRNPMNGSFGAKGAIDALYNENDRYIAQIRGTRGFMTGFDIVFVRSRKGDLLLNLIQRAVLEGIGYNADGLLIHNSIFESTFTAGLTVADEDALKYLYKTGMQ